MLHIYLASRVSRCQEMQQYAKQLERHNIAVVSSWINYCDETKHANRSNMPSEDRAAIAARDLADVQMAHALMLFSEHTPGAGNGRLIEFGYAMGLGKDCWVVGPLENLFLCLPHVVHLPTWEEALAYAQEESNAASSSSGYQGRATSSNAATSGDVRRT